MLHYLHFQAHPLLPTWAPVPLPFPAPGMPVSTSHSGNPATLQAPLSSHFSY